MQSDLDRRSWTSIAFTNPIFPSVVGSIVVYLARLLVLDSQENIQTLNATLLIGLIASILSVVAVRSVSRYPGAEAVSSILSLVSIMYGAVIAIVLIVRVDYVRSVIIGNYLLCLLFLFMQYSPWSARRRLRIGVIAGGEAKPFVMKNIEWVRLEKPDAPVTDLDAVTTDFRANLDPGWERRIVELALEGTSVYHIKHLRESLTGRLELEHLVETSFGTLAPPQFYITVKRIIDTFASLILLILMCPLFVLVSIAIKLDSDGPAIFKQIRTGFRGRPFTVYKFRTMRVSEEDGNDRNAAMTREDDNRITRIGRLLRKTRIDEIPQLVNVLRGEMSLIGPRPEAAILSSWYENEIPFYRYRHIVLPGVTGWAQINQGHVTDVQDVESKLHYDFYYIKHISPWIDCLIAFRTISVMLFGKGAK